MRFQLILKKITFLKKKLLAEDQFTHKFQKNNPIVELGEASFGDCELTTPNTVSWTNNEGLSHQKSIQIENESKEHDQRHGLNEISNAKFVEKSSDNKSFKLIKNEISDSLRKKANTNKLN